MSRERFDEDFARAIKGSGVPPRSDGEKTAHAIERLTRDTARKLITALKGEHYLSQAVLRTGRQAQKRAVDDRCCTYRRGPRSRGGGAGVR